MPIRDSQTFTFTPHSLADAADGTNGSPGTLLVCQNLVPAPSNPGMFAPRPAATKLIDLSAINPAGIISAIAVVGYKVYGMISSSTYAGKDQPFAYDLQASALQTIAGVSAATLPNSPPVTGDWIPPVMFTGAGSRVMLCHAGFVGGANPYLGWLDISGFSSTAYTTPTKGNTAIGSPVIRSLITPVGNSAPVLSNYQNGMIVSGAGIPANTVIVSSSNGVYTLSTTGSTTAASATVTAVAVVTGLEIGMLATGPQLTVGSTITAISGTTITLSNIALGTAASAAIIFTGGGTITLSQNATATASSVALTVSGGTLLAPLWGAGNLNGNPLTVVPICGAAFNARAWYGAANFVVFSDPVNPTQVSLASQALAAGDLTPVTALAPLPLTAQLSGGIQQSLTAYKGGESFYQITGDAALGTLAMNAVTGSVGTLAPNTISSTPQGVGMICIDGLRFLGVNGLQSERIGAEGSGVSVPFLNAIYPSRMCADYTENTFSVTVASATDPLGRAFKYWYDMTTQQWSGPHTFGSALVVSHPAGGAFLTVPINIPASIWFSDVIPRSTSTYIENGVPLMWTLETPLLPDNAQLNWNAVIEVRAALASPASQAIQAAVYDESNTQLGAATVRPDGSPAQTPLWGTAVWGAFTWGGASLVLRRYPLNWSAPLVFRQAKIAFNGQSTAGQLLGNVFIRYQVMSFGVDPGR